jgi:hypothetical protein
MRRTGGVIAFILVNAWAGSAHGQAAADASVAAKPSLYALVAAVGDRFTQVTEVQSTGTHLSPFRYSRSDVPNNVLNRIVLHSLDAAISKVDSKGERVYLSLPAVSMDGVPAPKQESVAIERIVAELERIPERLTWDRIVVATPAYEALARSGMPGRIQGLGMFSETLCQAGCGRPWDKYPAEIDSEPLDGVAVVTSDDQTIRAKTFLAPFSYIEVWVLDPRTLAVIDRQRGFDHRKLAEPVYRARMSEGAMQDYLNRRIVGLIETSIGEAIMRSEVNPRRGEVEVGTVRPVPPKDLGD